MALGTFLALLLFAFTTSITPGPNNMMLFASGVNFGFRRTIPHMLGIGVGFLSLLLGVGLGLGALLHTVPLLYTALKFAGGAYLVWIAWKIGTSRSLTESEGSAQPMSFMSAAATAGAALAGSAVPSEGEKTPPLHARPVARPRSVASRLLSMCVVTPAVFANSRQRAQRPISSSSSLR